MSIDTIVKYYFSGCNYWKFRFEHRTHSFWKSVGCSNSEVLQILESEFNSQQNINSNHY